MGNFYKKYIYLVLIILLFGCETRDCISSDEFGENNNDTFKVPSSAFSCGYIYNEISYDSYSANLVPCIEKKRNAIFQGSKCSIVMNNQTCNDLKGCILDQTNACISLFPFAESDLEECSNKNVENLSDNDILNIKNELKTAYVSNCLISCKNECITNFPQFAFEPNWSPNTHLEEGGNIGIKITPSNTIKVQTTGRISLNVSNEKNFNFTPSLKIQSKPNNFNTLLGFARTLNSFNISGNWKKDNGEMVGEILTKTIEIDDDIKKYSDIEQQYNFLRRTVLILKDLPSCETNETPKDNTNCVTIDEETGAYYGPSQFPDFTNWSCEFKGDMDTYESCIDNHDYSQDAYCCRANYSGNYKDQYDFMYKINNDFTKNIGGTIIPYDRRKYITKYPFKNIFSNVNPEGITFSDNSFNSSKNAFEVSKNGLRNISLAYPTVVAFRVVDGKFSRNTKTQTCKVYVTVKNNPFINKRMLEVKLDDKWHFLLDDKILNSANSPLRDEYTGEYPRLILGSDKLYTLPKENVDDVYSKNTYSVDIEVEDKTWNYKTFTLNANGREIEQERPSYDFKCGEGMVVFFIPLNEITIEKSGFASIKNLLSNRQNTISNGNIPELYQQAYTNLNTFDFRFSIINANTKKVGRLEMEKNFYEYANKANNMLPSYRSFTIIPYNNSWSNEIYVRKGQILRFTEDNWFDIIGGKNTYDIKEKVLNYKIGSSNAFVSVGDGVVMKIEERPAYLCNGTKKEEVENNDCLLVYDENDQPYCKVKMDGTCNVTVKNSSGQEAATGSYCPSGCYLDEDKNTVYFVDKLSSNCELSEKDKSLVTVDTCKECKKAKDLCDKDDDCEEVSCDNYKNSPETYCPDECVPTNEENTYYFVEPTQACYSLDNVINDSNVKTTLASCKSCRDSLNAKNIKPTIKVDLIQCYDLEDYSGAVRNLLDPSNNSLTDTSITLGAKKLESVFDNLNAGNLEGLTLNSQVRTKFSYSYNGSLNFVSNPKTFHFMVIDNSDFNFSNKETFERQGEITLSITPNLSYSAGEQMAVAIAKNDWNFTTEPLYWIVKYNTNTSNIETYGTLAIDSPYKFNNAGVLVDSKTGVAGVPMASISPYLNMSESEYENLRLWFKIIDKPITDTTCSNKLEIPYTEGNKNSCQSMYSDNDGEYNVQLQAPKSVMNTTGYVIKYVFKPIMELLDGKMTAVAVDTQGNPIPCQESDGLYKYGGTLPWNKIESGCSVSDPSYGVYCIESQYCPNANKDNPKYCFLPGADKNKMQKGCKIDSDEHIVNDVNYCFSVPSDRCVVYNENSVVTSGNDNFGSKCRPDDKNCFRDCSSLAASLQNSYCKTVSDGKGFVQSFYVTIITDSEYQIILKICLILMLTFYGLYYLLGMAEMTYGELIKMAIKIGFIYLMVGREGWYYYNKFFVTFFKGGVDYIVFAIASSFDDSANLASAFATHEFYDKSVLFSGIDVVLDVMFSDEATYKIWGLLFVSFFGWLYTGLIYSAILTYITSISNALLLYITAQFFISFLLAFGPIFFILLLFNKTKEMFKKWVNSLVSLSLEQIFLLTTLGLFNTLMYAVFKFVLSYRVCWKPIWTVQLPIIGKFTLLNFWRATTTKDPTSAAKSLPGLFHILFIYIVSELLDSFVTLMVKLGGKLGGGGVSSATISGDIKKAAGKIYDACRDKFMDTAGNIGKTIAQRAIGYRTADDYKKDKDNSKAFKAGMKTARKAMEHAMSDYRERNAERLASMGSKEAEQTLNKVGKQAFMDSLSNNKTFQDAKSALGIKKDDSELTLADGEIDSPDLVNLGFTTLAHALTISKRSKTADEFVSEDAKDKSTFSRKEFEKIADEKTDKQIASGKYNSSEENTLKAKNRTDLDNIWRMQNREQNNKKALEEVNGNIFKVASVGLLNYKDSKNRIETKKKFKEDIINNKVNDITGLSYKEMKEKQNTFRRFTSSGLSDAEYRKAILGKNSSKYGGITDFSKLNKEQKKELETDIENARKIDMEFDKEYKEAKKEAADEVLEENKRMRMEELQKEGLYIPGENDNDYMGSSMAILGEENKASITNWSNDLEGNAGYMEKESKGDEKL